MDKGLKLLLVFVGAAVVTAGIDQLIGVKFNDVNIFAHIGHKLMYVAVGVTIGKV